MMYKVDLTTRHFYLINVPEEIIQTNEIDEHIKRIITNNMKLLLTKFDYNFKIEKTEVPGILLN